MTEPLWAPNPDHTPAQVGAVTDVGPTRIRNEDAVLLPGVILGAADRGSWAGSVAPGGRALVAVIDGMGGHGAGSVASVLVASVLNEQAAALPAGAEPDPAWFRAAVQDCADLVTDVGGLRAPTRIMGAAAAGLLVGRGEVLVFNVGDCRVYVWEAGYLSQLTTDHRARASGRLTRSLGGTGEREAVEPDIVPMDRAVGRRYLLCSDGLSEALEFDEIRDLIAAGSPGSVAAALVDWAIAAEARDNVTAVVVDVPGR